MKHRHGNILAVLHYFTIIIERNALDNLEYLEHLEKYTKKTRGNIIADIVSLRGRLPTLPLSQYHRRGEA